MDKIINYLLLTIIFVFDPLAIALVIAANFAFEKLRPKIKENIYGEKVPVEEKEDDSFWTKNEMQDFNEQFNADDALPDKDKVVEENNELRNLIKKTNIAKSPDISSWRRNKVLNELEKKFDLNKDGVLDTEENIRLNYYKRLQKLKDDNQKTY